MSFLGARSTHFFILWSIRLILVIGIIHGFVSERGLLTLVAIIGFVFSFAFSFFRKVFGFRKSTEAEIVLILFIFGILIFADTRGLFGGHVFWKLVLDFASSVALGIVGFIVLTSLEKEELIEANYFIISVLTFCFAFTLGGLWEIFEYAVDNLFGYGLQAGGLKDTMMDLVIDAIGASIVSISGFYYLRSGKKNLLGFILWKLFKKNFRFFRSRKYLEHSSRLIENLIEKGEGERLEFKSTLRRNVYTNMFDKKIEHSVLKSIDAFLNSEGGVLLVGVDDKGNVVGLEKEGFSSNDKLKIYFTTLLRKGFGNRFLHYIDFEVFPVRDKHVLKVECAKSDREVFLKWNGEEEFYIRHGSSSIKLSGSDLIEYIEKRFR